MLSAFRAQRPAFDYLRKGPQAVEEVPRRVAQAFEALVSDKQTPGLHRAAGDGVMMIGTSSAMQTLHRLIERVAPTDANVLIRGETGTGKELVAKALHAASLCCHKPFEPLDGNIPENLAESMLFGVIANYPGFHRQESLVGVFEQANNGTLFLDEIGDLPLTVQPKLLRALQEKTIRPLGAPHTVRVDVRVIAATNRNLEQMMEEGQFRVDLYHRLNVVTLETVPLRQRRDDIPALVAHFLVRACTVHRRSRMQLSEDALAVLLAYDYPGNVRELENLLDRAVILTTGETIFPEVLPVRPKMEASVNLEPRLIDLTLSEAVSRLEKTYLEQQLRHTQGNISQAALRAGIDRKNFRDKLKKYNIAGT